MGILIDLMTPYLTSVHSRHRENGCFIDSLLLNSPAENCGKYTYTPGYILYIVRTLTFTKALCYLRRFIMLTTTTYNNASGLLQLGDEILEINKVAISELRLDEACTKLRG